MGLAGLVVFTVLVISGVWGLAIIQGRFKRQNLERGSDDPRIAGLQEDHHQLEARFQRLEEEVSFLVELRKPEPATQLPRPGDSEPET